MLIRCCSVALLLTVLPACGEGSRPGAEEPGSISSPTGDIAEAPAEPKTDEATQSPGQEPTQAGIKILAAGSEFGPMLFDRTGQAIYLFDIEKTSMSRCYGSCAEAWPPVLTGGDPVAGPGVDSSLLGTSERRDGTAQVTYNGHPLYFYAHEGKREVKCHDVFLNGGDWYVVQPDGDAAPPG